MNLETLLWRTRKRSLQMNELNAVINHKIVEQRLRISLRKGKIDRGNNRQTDRQTSRQTSFVVSFAL